MHLDGLSTLGLFPVTIVALFLPFRTDLESVSPPEESSQSAVETNKQAATSSSERLVPGMSQYGDSQDIFSDNHDVDMDVGIEDSQKADQESAAISQRCEFFVLSPS